MDIDISMCFNIYFYLKILTSAYYIYFVKYYITKYTFHFNIIYNLIIYLFLISLDF